MENKDKFDFLMRIAEFNIKQFNERREYSWKITFGFWASIIGSVAVIREYIQSINVQPSACIASIVIGVGIIVFCFHLYWLYKVFNADKDDKKLSFKARDIAIGIIESGLDEKDLIDLKNQKPKFNIDKRGFIEDWSAIFQLLVTGMLIIIAIILVIASHQTGGCIQLISGIYSFGFFS